MALPTSAVPAYLEVGDQDAKESVYRIYIMHACAMATWRSVARRIPHAWLTSSRGKGGKRRWSLEFVQKMTVFHLDSIPSLLCPEKSMSILLVCESKHPSAIARLVMRDLCLCGQTAKSFLLRAILCRSVVKLGLWICDRRWIYPCWGTTNDGPFGFKKSFCW